MGCITLNLLLFGCLIAHVSGYRSGLISAACDTMEPNHGFSPQTSVALYTVTASQSFFSPGDKITVTLEGHSVTFKGFLLQARSASGGNIVGSFTVTESDAQTLNCNGEGSAVSHTNPNEKSSISAVWSAPDGSGNVTFRATFVQSFREFWVGVQSPLLTVVSNTPTATSSTILSVSSSNSSQATSTPSTQGTSTQHGNSTLAPIPISRDSCGIEKVCFMEPTDCDPSTTNSCFFMSSAPVSGGGYWFEISGLSSGYVAIGFSDDMQMGNDDIYICGRDSAGNVGVQRAFSTGKSRPQIVPLDNLVVSLASYTNGVIQCSFITRNNISTQSPLRASSDLYYFFMAFAPYNGGQIAYHGTTGRFISSTKLDPSVPTNGTRGTVTVDPMSKAHGALMLIAWMTTVSLGMVIARYLKVAAKRLVFGKALWFQSHFVLMTLTVAATIVAFVLAFVKQRGWSSWANNHAIIGCVVMGLALFQPIIALFRPSPQSSRRYLFNWFHGLNALVMKVLAVANLFLGLQFLDSEINWLVKVMGGFVGWEALAFIVLEINARLAQREMKKNLDINKESQSLVKSEVFLLIIYLLGNLVFLLTLIVGISQS
ncbi:putative ferric-chelate reductase 1 isoform 1-T2 [Discoglossus pictus]